MEVIQIVEISTDSNIETRSSSKSCESEDSQKLLPSSKYIW